jgi:hypothetical protein
VALNDSRVNGSDAGTALSVAPNGDIIAGGALEPPSGPNNSAFFVVALGADGRERWRYESPGTDYFLEAHAIAFDRNGNPVVTGLSQESSQALSTFTVVAFNKDTGAVLWDVPIIGTAPFTNTGNAVASDPGRGAVIAVGVTQNDRT